MTTRSGPRSQRVFTAIGILALFAPASSAVAQQPLPAPDVVGSPRLVLTVADCAEREDAIRAVVAVEVGDLLLERGVPAVAGHDHLLVTCGRGPATIEARAALASTAAQRSLDLGAFPGDAAPRALALAALETLAEVSPGLRRRLQERARAKSGPVVPPPPSTQTPAPPPAEPGPVTLPPVPSVVSLSAVWRGFRTAEGARLWGARLAVDRQIAWRWNAALDLEVMGQSREIDAGTVSVAAVSLGAFWGLRVGGPAVVGTVGAGGRVGMVNFSGHPDDAGRFASASVIRPWLGPALMARVLVNLGRWVLSGAVEGGVTVRGAQGVANDDIASALDGPWLAFGAGFGIRL